VRPRLVLFDIDGTLLSSQGAGGRALKGALREVFGRLGPMDGYSFAGRTDPQIVLDLMRRAGFREGFIREKMPLVFELYLQRLPEEIRKGLPPTLFPGVLPLLKALKREERAILGLLTGNIEAGAEIKLAALNLQDYFSVGAYGSDAEERNHLPWIVLQRVRGKFDRHLNEGDMVVIGDTPLDVGCAREVGARSIAVATGVVGREELEGCGADYLFDDFREYRRVIAAIFSQDEQGSV